MIIAYNKLIVLKVNSIHNNGQKIIFLSTIAVLAYGLWLSSDFNQIAAGVAIFLFGMLSLEQGFHGFTGGTLEKYYVIVLINFGKVLALE